MITALIGRFWWQIPAALGCLGIIATWDSSRKAKWVESGKQEVVRASEKEGAKNAAAADKAHAAAAKPGAADRLRQNRATCPDCGK